MQPSSAGGIVRHSLEEQAMRDMIVPRLRQDYPEARIVHELPLRYSTNRIDLAAITPDRIIAVEVKSSRDEMRRLERQVRAFLPVSPKIIVALAPKWLRKPKGAKLSVAEEILGRIGRVETWAVCAETATLDKVDGGTHALATPWSAQLLDMLWRAELEAIATEYGVAVKRRPSHSVLRDACEAALTGTQIRTAVCTALRARIAFGKASDAALISGAFHSTGGRVHGRFYKAGSAGDH